MAYFSHKALRRYWPMRPDLFNCWYLKGSVAQNENPDLLLKQRDPMFDKVFGLLPETPDSALSYLGNRVSKMVRQTSFNVIAKDKVVVNFASLAAFDALRNFIKKKPTGLELTWPYNFSTAFQLSRQQFCVLGVAPTSELLVVEYDSVTYTYDTLGVIDLEESHATKVLICPRVLFQKV